MLTHCVLFRHESLPGDAIVIKLAGIIQIGGEDYAAGNRRQSAKYDPAFAVDERQLLRSLRAFTPLARD